MVFFMALDTGLIPHLGVISFSGFESRPELSMTLKTFCTENSLADLVTRGALRDAFKRCVWFGEVPR